MALSLRTVLDGIGDHRLHTVVAGLRQDFPMPVSAPACDWFICHFHQPCILLLRSGERSLPAGCAVLWAPGEQVGHRPQGRTLTRSWLRLRGDAVAGMVEAAGLATGMAYPQDGPDGAVAHLELLHRACTTARPPGAALLHAQIGAWLFAIAHQAGGATESGSSDGGGAAAVRLLLERHWRQRLPLDRLAELAECSRAQVVRDFRRLTGLPPGAYQQALRLDHAAELLATTALGIPAIAEACGFADRYHLSRAFAARHGLGPAAWRRLSRGRPAAR